MGRLLLVRHGQASFGAADYDVLSDTGRTQSRRLGLWLTKRGVEPDVVIHGTLSRQRDTAAEMVEAAGWDVPTQLDDRWDEFDHLQVPALYGGADMQTMDRREFQAAFEAATARWTAGEAPPTDVDPDSYESFAAFVARIRDALSHASRQAGPGATVVAVSSGGPIAVAAALLLDLDGPALATAWGRLNTVIVNSSATSVVVGASGARLLTFNEHLHVSGELLTYR